MLYVVCVCVVIGNNYCWVIFEFFVEFVYICCFEVYVGFGVE